MAIFRKLVGERATQRSVTTLSLLISIACVPSLFSEDLVLHDFANQATLQKAVTQDTRLSLVSNESGSALRVEAGTNNPWPSVIFPTPAGLDLSEHGYLVVPVKNPGKETLQVYCRIDSRPKNAPESAGLIRTTQISLNGGESKENRIPLIPYVHHPDLKPKDFFGMRGIPFFSEKSMHLNNVTTIIFFVTKLEAPRVFEVGNLRLEGKPAKPELVPDKPFPLIDQFGQFKHREWPGKTHSVDEMRSRKDEESKRLASMSPPASWSRFGGWKHGPQLEATGWFRTAKHDGKWHLVDPDGRLFFSLGIDNVGFCNGTIIDERKHWFENLPPDDADHNEFYWIWKGNMPNYYYFGKNARVFNFQKYNVMRKYGAGWEQAFIKTSAERLPAWGINTIGNWSDPAICALQKLPYVTFLSAPAPAIEGSSGYWGKFADVFHPDFKNNLRQRLNWKQIAITKSDPWCIGYFVDNELSWGDETSLAVATLTSPAEQKAKQVFVADLKAKYESIAAFNKAWRTEYASWDTLLASTQAAAIEAARPDLEAFYEKIANTYFSSIREVLKEFAPHHLYRGCRFFSGAVNPIAAKTSGRTWLCSCAAAPTTV